MALTVEELNLLSDQFKELYEKRNACADTVETLTKTVDPLCQQLNSVQTQVITLNLKLAELTDRITTEGDLMQDQTEELWDAAAPVILDMLRYLRDGFEGTGSQKKWWKEVKSIIPV